MIKTPRNKPFSLFNNFRKTVSKENENPNIERLSIHHVKEEANRLFATGFQELEHWIACGESEVYLRKLFNLERENNLPGYSIATFDFIVYFKNYDMSVESNRHLAFSYLRRLTLADFQTKIKSNFKYVGFHKRHDAVIKIWNKLLRVIGLQADCPNDAYQCIRMKVIRQYMQFCHENQQSKSHQLRDLINILHQFWLLEVQQEKESEKLPFSLLKFCRLWKQRYNNDSRIVVNTSGEQMEQRQLFCNSANTLESNFDNFSRKNITQTNLKYFMDQLGAFILINNSRTSYNCSQFQMKNSFKGATFDFSMQEFENEILPYVRRAVNLLSRVSSLQSNHQLSLYESFWDVTFLVRFLHVVRISCLQNQKRPMGLKDRSNLVEHSSTQSMYVEYSSESKHFEYKMFAETNI